LLEMAWQALAPKRLLNTIKLLAPISRPLRQN